MQALQVYTDECLMDEEEHGNHQEPFTYNDINTLHHDYKSGIPEAIEYMNQLSDKCMADIDYQFYC